MSGGPQRFAGLTPKAVVTFFTAGSAQRDGAWQEPGQAARAHDLNWSIFDAGTFDAVMELVSGTGSATAQGRVRDTTNGATVASVSTQSGTPVRLQDTSPSLPDSVAELQLQIQENNVGGSKAEVNAASLSVVD